VQCRVVVNQWPVFGGPTHIFSCHVRGHFTNGFGFFPNSPISSLPVGV
jgi:hypothetical protein